jgi:hypothetical protein
MATTTKPRRRTGLRAAAPLAVAAMLLLAPVAWALGELSQKSGTAACVSEDGSGGRVPERQGASAGMEGVRSHSAVRSTAPTRMQVLTGSGPAVLDLATCATDRVAGPPGVVSDRSVALLCRGCASRRCACCRLGPRRLASAPGCRLRGGAAAAVHADVAAGPDDLRY